MWYGAWLGLTAAWSVGSLGALLILRQSMSLCKVRNAHVFRVHVYAMLSAMLRLIGYCLLVTLVDCIMAFWPAFGDSAPVSVVLAVYPLVAWFWVAMNIALAFRLCIKMRHAWWVALSSQAIALMLAICVGFVPLWIRWMLL